MTRPKLKIHAPQIIHQENKVIVSIQLESLSLAKHLWYSLDKEFAPLLCDNSDAPLVALLVPAMANGEDIHLTAPVSEKLWHALSGRYQHLLQCMLPGLKKINIIPGDIQVRQHKALGAATGFSAGIDSFCLLADHFYSPVTTGFKITHLLFNNVGSHGAGEAAEILFEKRYAHIADVPKRLNLPFIKINTNIDSFYAPYGDALDFVKTHTPRNASVALLLQNGIKHYLYASTFHFTDLKIEPTNDIALSDPISLPLLSTEILDILSVGSEYTRVEKTLRVAEIIDSYDTLNVCVNGTEAANCSQCWKCMRTLLTLEITGVLQRYTKVFKLDCYMKHRAHYIAEALKNPDLLTLEMIKFAKKIHFPLELAQPLDIKPHTFSIAVKNTLSSFKKKDQPLKVISHPLKAPMDYPINTTRTVPLKLFNDENNFGDQLGLIICQKLSPHIIFRKAQPYQPRDELNLLSIGSILKGADTNSLVWGAGFIDTNEYLHSRPKAIYAVRGPLTNKKIQQQGLPAAKVLGDPACLIKYFYGDNTPTVHKYGIVPHYVDKNDKRVMAMMQRDDVLIIDVQQNPEIVIKQIKSCSYILSSSLHGLICADALEVPAVYTKFSNHLAGNGFKFLDYFLSCGRKDHFPYIVEDNIDLLMALKKIENFKYKMNISALIDCFPIH